MDKYHRKECPPCPRYQDYERPPLHGAIPPEGPCPETLEEMCQEVNKKFREWKKWGDNVNDTMFHLVEWIWRLEHALCCLEGHVIYGKERPDEGLICDGRGGWQRGTLHSFAPPAWPISDPPDEPWNGDNGGGNGGDN